ncbi:MAG: hypothetical protein ACRCWW_10700 [Scandinavium sp.]
MSRDKFLLNRSNKDPGRSLRFNGQAL